jgi:hypothetical protein
VNQATSAVASICSILGLTLGVDLLLLLKALIVLTTIEVLNVKVHMFVLLIFASLPDCSQNQTAVSDTLRLLSDF